MTAALETLDVDEVLRIHERLVEDFAQSPDPIIPSGVRDIRLLESAIDRQHVGSKGQLKYSSIHDNAATLLFGLCNNHPFHNGNKRTALVSMLAHLDKNRCTLSGTSQKELFDLMIRVATHDIGSGRRTRHRSRSTPRRKADDEVEAIASWLSSRMHRITRGERQITFRELGSILNRFGFYLDRPRKNSIDILRRETVRRGLLRREEGIVKKIGNIPYPGEGRPIGIRLIKQVREMCRLSEADGVDSAAFYDADTVIDAFINEYRTVLRRLARR